MRSRTPSRAATDCLTDSCEAVANFFETRTNTLYRAVTELRGLLQERSRSWQSARAVVRAAAGQRVAHELWLAGSVRANEFAKELLTEVTQRRLKEPTDQRQRNQIIPIIGEIEREGERNRGREQNSGEETTLVKPVRTKTKTRAQAPQRSSRMEDKAEG